MTRHNCSCLRGEKCEDHFLTEVIALAILRTWRVHHQRPARTGKGWRTAIQGDTGFPDLVLVRLSQIIIAELKSRRGKVSLDQRFWLNALELTGKVRVYTWRPEDWPAIEAALA